MGINFREWLKYWLHIWFLCEFWSFSMFFLINISRVNSKVRSRRECQKNREIAKFCTNEVALQPPERLISAEREIHDLWLALYESRGYKVKWSLFMGKLMRPFNDLKPRWTLYNPWSLTSTLTIHSYYLIRTMWYQYQGKNCWDIFAEKHETRTQNSETKIWNTKLSFPL